MYILTQEKTYKKLYVVNIITQRCVISKTITNK